MAQDKPKIALNLDTLEREDTPEPFWVTLDGKPYQLRDPQEIDWNTLLTLRSDPADFLRCAVNGDRREPWLASLGKQPAWKITRLSKAYAEHHGLPQDPEVLASPTS